jgi:hypothetical protein
VIGLVSAALINILKLLCASSNLHGAGQGWIGNMETTEEVRIRICQQMDDKDLFQRLLRCYTGMQFGAGIAPTKLPTVESTTSEPKEKEASVSFGCSKKKKLLGQQVLPTTNKKTGSY